MEPLPVTSLYLHVPFCAHKCEYCAFYSHAPSGDLVNRYIQAVIKELELVAAQVKPRTIFFGGGTPSLLNLQQWGAVLKAMERLNLLGATEWTVECNPATVSLDKAKLLRDFGVNRVSMGVQSFDPALLERLGRIHSREMVFKSYDTLRAGGFSNINLDLMFGIPGQTMKIWHDTLKEAVHLAPEHLSSYEVIYEEDTPLFQQLQAGEFEVNEELACEMYDALLHVAGENGYTQYEVANFGSGALNHGVPEFACKHNLNYWQGGFYVAVGPSACGFEPDGTGNSLGIRTRNWSNTQMYCELIEKGTRAIESTERLDNLHRASEIAAFGLRMNTGWKLGHFTELTGYNLQQEWKNEIEDLTSRGWAVLRNDQFHLTSKGMRFADAAAELFLRA
ncbi:MAG: radical SAM family heme chaperone HemW [Verrucomicrobiota bacterium]|nr:radical SAM family heme chaperone HemW [Verrucomicrobiota bacterium]